MNLQAISTAFGSQFGFIGGGYLGLTAPYLAAKKIIGSDALPPFKASESNTALLSAACKIAGYLPVVRLGMGACDILSGGYYLYTGCTQHNGERLIARGALELAGFPLVLLITDLAVTALRFTIEKIANPTVTTTTTTTTTSPVKVNE